MDLREPSVEAVPADRPHLRSVWARVLAHRGDRAGLHRVFEETQIPMLLLASDHRYLDANRASCLFLRRTRGQLRRMRSDDLIAPEQRAHHQEIWANLLRDGSAADRFPLLIPDGTAIQIDFWAVTDVLPGAHLAIWLPSNWSPEELADGLAPPRDSGAHGTAGERLSPREREVLEVLATGATLQQIAEALQVSPSTVRTHIRNAMRRLHARHRAHAVAIALRDGEITLR